MNANDVYEAIQRISAKRVGGAPVFVDELAEEMQTDRRTIISFLVDLKIAGYIDFDTRTVSLTVTSVTTNSKT